MTKLKLSDFDDYNFETELASESFYINTKCSECRIVLKCVVKPIINEVNYFVLVQGIFCKLYKFVFLEDAIDYYNKILDEEEI